MAHNDEYYRQRYNEFNNMTVQEYLDYLGDKIDHLMGNARVQKEKEEHDLINQCMKQVDKDEENEIIGERNHRHIMTHLMDLFAAARPGYFHQVGQTTKRLTLRGGGRRTKKRKTRKMNKPRRQK